MTSSTVTMYKIIVKGLQRNSIWLMYDTTQKTKSGRWASLLSYSKLALNIWSFKIWPTNQYFSDHLIKTYVVVFVIQSLHIFACFVPHCNIAIRCGCRIHVWNLGDCISNLNISVDISNITCFNTSLSSSDFSRLFIVNMIFGIMVLIQWFD